MIAGRIVDMAFLGTPFRNQHTIIRARLADVLKRSVGGNGYDVAVLFERLSLALRSHLLMEDNVIYPAMTVSRDRELRDRALTLRDRYREQSANFERLYARWADRRLIEGDVSAFAHDLEIFAHEIVERMDVEDALLYGRIASANASGISPATRPTGRLTASF